MKRSATVLVVLFGAIACASAQAVPLTYFKVADEWGTIQAVGPRTGTSGVRFWNAQGSGGGANASTAPVRFYMSDIVADANTQFGAGQWVVTNVNIVFSQNNATFTHHGPLNLYWFANDALNITGGPGTSDGATVPGNFSSLTASALRYEAGVNALDTRLSDGTTDVAAIFGATSLVDSYTFYNSGSANGDGSTGDWPLDVLAPFTAGNYSLIDPENPAVVDALNATYNYGIGAPIVSSTATRSDTLANFTTATARTLSHLDIAPINSDVISGTDALSFIVVATDAATTATYKGNPNGTANFPPRIYLTIDAAPASGNGDWNGDGHVNAADYVTWRNDPDNHGGPGGYGIWRANFGNPPGSGAELEGGAVPEPASLALVAIGVAALVCRRRAS